MLDILKKVLRGGFKTSEFWVVILAILAPAVLGILDKIFGLTMTATGGAETFIGGLVAAVYVFVRGWLKARAAGTAITASGNTIGAGLGSPKAEAEFRRAAVPSSDR